MEFDGGTYVIQARSFSKSEAPKICIEEWELTNIKTVMTDIEKADILNQLKEEEFVPLQNTTNVWCGMVILKDKPVLMNLVLTNDGI